MLVVEDRLSGAVPADEEGARREPGGVRRARRGPDRLQLARVRRGPERRELLAGSQAVVVADEVPIEQRADRLAQIRLGVGANRRAKLLIPGGGVVRPRRDHLVEKLLRFAVLSRAISLYPGGEGLGQRRRPSLEGRPHPRQHRRRRRGGDARAARAAAGRGLGPGGRQRTPLAPGHRQRRQRHGDRQPERSSAHAASYGARDGQWSGSASATMRFCLALLPKDAAVGRAARRRTPAGRRCARRRRPRRRRSRRRRRAHRDRRPPSGTETSGPARRSRW